MRSLTAASFLLFLTATLLFSPSIGGIILTILTPSQPLAVGDTLVSPGRIFALGFFTAGNSSNRYVGIWYYKIPTTVVWVANRQNPIASLTANLSITAEGALVITDKGTMIWSSDLSGLKNARAQIADSGNLVVGEATDNSKNPVRIVSGGWQSFDHPTDTMLPGMKLEWWRNGKSGRSSNLTAWSSESDPTPSTYVVEIDSRNGLEFLLQSNGRRIWRSGPWNETHFTGILGTKNFIMGLNISKSIDSDESDESDESLERERNQVLIHQSSLNFSSSVLLSRVTVDHSGIIRLLEWQEASKTWEVSWSAPGDQCDNISACGPFGICDTGGSSSSMCSCLPGFEPKSPANWKAMNWSEGCVRKTKVKLCMTSSKSPADVYTAVKDVKMPDTTSAEIANCQDCAENCLKICTCTAYAFVIPNNRHNCIMWFSELKDLRKYITSDEQVIYVRVTEADLRSHTHQRRNIAIVVGAFLGALALLLALVGFVFLKKKNNRRNNGLTVISGYIGSPYSPNADRGGEMNDFELPLFDLSIIEAATNHFSVENKIGEGGFGPVYKGQLWDGETIAVKRLAKTSIQGPDEFKNEVMLIAKLQHRNLVRILGCCMQGDERILIYEYMPNGSLDAFLFDKSGRRSLDWGTRYSIILGIARGLVYLHQDSRFRVIHRDLKASNILLDKDMNPKISDFGIARMFDGEDTSVNTARVVGTYGYMSPEYAMDGIFSVKSDVYSFGVLVLEIISGKRNRGIYAPKCNENLLGLAWSLWGEGNSLQLVDESMHLSFPLAQVTRCIQLGLLCVQERPEDRPTMSSVVLLLGSETAYLRYPKQPGFVAMKSRSDLDSSSSMQLPTTANDIPITTLEGR